jgi:TetR/AcrR family transcriptional repressor of bet genes
VGRPSNTEERRSQIVDGLLTIMAEEGYAHATIAKIARSAGLAPGLVHYHFESKQQILVALIERLVQGLDARFQARLAEAGDDARARLFAFIDAHVALGDDADPRAVGAWVVIGAEAVRQEEVRALFSAAIERSLERLRALIGAYLAAEGRTKKNAARFAAAVLAAIEGAYRLSAGAPGALPAGFAAPTIRRMIEGLVAAEPVK